ncbi:DMT family transporter [Chamaesiphon minutus]|uniref:DMT(Drug/metabolite transporter) superfamily permease n=1 Tax=Chamaesiphon minutus (strain ATCC 27169 / PCC 6605) TaxID=1173020 RepID=K9UIP0_CHAP6|nr:DMT(drug/metabolite transporter) superfamily permease [Chamaesiphon minutus PCC 6605]
MQLNKSPYSFSLTSILLVMPFFLWGTAMVAMKGVMPHTTPLFMAGMRLIPAGVLVLMVAALSKRAQPQSWQAWAWILLFAIVDGTLFQGFLAAGLVRTTAGLGSVMIDSQPLAVALLSAWLFKERIGAIGICGLILGVLGISCIGLPIDWLSQIATSPVASQFDLSGLSDRGEWLMLLAALSMAVGTILIPFVTKYVDPVIATGWHMIIGGVPLAIGSFYLESNQWTAINSYDWLAIGYSTIFGSAIAYGLFFYFASKGNLTSLSSLTFLTPVFALLFGSLFLGEALDLLQWCGVSLTLVSILLINQRDYIWSQLTGIPLNVDNLSESTSATQPSIAASTQSTVVVPKD